MIVTKFTVAVIQNIAVWLYVSDNLGRIHMPVPSRHVGSTWLLQKQKPRAAGAVTAAVDMCAGDGDGAEFRLQSAVARMGYLFLGMRTSVGCTELSSSMGFQLPSEKKKAPLPSVAAVESGQRWKLEHHWTYSYLQTRWWTKTQISSLARLMPGHILGPLPNPRKLSRRNSRRICPG